MGLIMLFIGINYILINNFLFHSYMLRPFFFTIVCALLYKNSSIIHIFNKYVLFISIIFSIQALFIWIVYFLGFSLSYESWYFIGGDRSFDFNLLYGIELDPNYIRSTSYFTESNRFGYFLTPSFFVCLFYSRKNIFYLILLFIIGLAIVSTFSLATLVSVIFGLLIYIKKNKKLFRLIPFLIILLPVLFFISLIGSDFLLFMFDKAGSIEDRMFGIINRIMLIKAYPFGTPDSVLATIDLLEGGSSTITLLYWLQIGGIQSIIFFIPLLFFWVKSIITLINSANIYYLCIGCGSLCFFLQQSFYGTYFEYYFLIIMSINVVLSNYDSTISSKRSSIGLLAF